MKKTLLQKHLKINLKSKYWNVMYKLTLVWYIIHFSKNKYILIFLLVSWFKNVLDICHGKREKYRSFFFAASFHSQYSYFSTTSPQVRFFEFWPNRWYVFLPKERVTQKRRWRDRAGCMRVRVRLRWVCSTYQNTLNSTSRGQISRVRAMFIKLRNDSGLPVMERSVFYTQPPLKKPGREMLHISASFAEACPQLSSHKAAEKHKSIWPAGAFDVATQCLTETRTALKREVCVNLPALVQHLETRLGEANAIGLEAAVELREHGFK